MTLEVNRCGQYSPVAAQPSAVALRAAIDPFLHIAAKIDEGSTVEDEDLVILDAAGVQEAQYLRVGDFRALAQAAEKL